MITALALMIATTVQTETLDMKVQWVRPSRLVSLINGRTPIIDSVFDPHPTNGHVGEFLREGVTSVADDSAGLIHFSGSNKEDLSDAVEIARLFDVKAKRVRFDLHIQSELDHFVGDSSTSVANNERWTYGLSSIGLELLIVPRVNEDGSVTAFVSQKMGDFDGKCVLRFRNGQSFEISAKTFGEMGGKSTVKSNFPAGFSYQIKPTILED